jgi:hypothetical protein
VTEPVPIQYREFYDVPRMFVVTYNGTQFLFDGSFRDDLDDYPDEYDVMVLPGLSPQELAGSWADLPARAMRNLGRVSTVAVVFDPSRRQSIEGALLRQLLMKAAG